MTPRRGFQEQCAFYKCKICSIFLPSGISVASHLFKRHKRNILPKKNVHLTKERLFLKPLSRYWEWVEFPVASVTLQKQDLPKRAPDPPVVDQPVPFYCHEEEESEDLDIKPEIFFIIEEPESEPQSPKKTKVTKIGLRKSTRNAKITADGDDAKNIRNKAVSTPSTTAVTTRTRRSTNLLSKHLQKLKPPTTKVPTATTRKRSGASLLSKNLKKPKPRATTTINRRSYRTTKTQKNAPSKDKIITRTSPQRRSSPSRKKNIPKSQKTPGICKNIRLVKTKTPTVIQKTSSVASSSTTTTATTRSANSAVKSIKSKTKTPKKYVVKLKNQPVKLKTASKSSEPPPTICKNIDMVKIKTPITTEKSQSDDTLLIEAPTTTTARSTNPVTKSNTPQKSYVNQPKSKLASKSRIALPMVPTICKHFDVVKTKTKTPTTVEKTPSADISLIKSPSTTTTTARSTNPVGKSQTPKKPYVKSKSPPAEEGFSCDLCFHSFRTLESLQNHKLHHGNEFICSFCGVGFTTEIFLDFHEKIQHSHKTFKYTSKEKFIKVRKKRKIKEQAEQEKSHKKKKLLVEVEPPPSPENVLENPAGETDDPHRPEEVEKSNKKRLVEPPSPENHDENVQNSPENPAEDFYDDLQEIAVEGESSASFSVQSDELKVKIIPRIPNRPDTEYLGFDLCSEYLNSPLPENQKSSAVSRTDENDVFDLGLDDIPVQVTLVSDSESDDDILEFMDPQEYSPGPEQTELNQNSSEMLGKSTTTTTNSTTPSNATSLPTSCCTSNATSLLKCPNALCNSSFTCNHALKSHVDSVHPSTYNFLYECHLCKDRFLNHSHYKMHYRNNHIKSESEEPSRMNPDDKCSSGRNKSQRMEMTSGQMIMGTTGFKVPIQIPVMGGGHMIIPPNFLLNINTEVTPTGSIVGGKGNVPRKP